MPGENRFKPSFYQPLGKGGVIVQPPKAPCVFISHKREDSEMSSEVGAMLLGLGLDIWLDLDQDLAADPVTEDEHRRLTESIETGLQSSTHLLALVTPQAERSWWVPFEIGSCRAMQKGLAFLVHRDIRNPPSYLAVGERLDHMRSLVDWGSTLASSPGTVSLGSLLRSRLQNASSLAKFLKP